MPNTKETRRVNNVVITGRLTRDPDVRYKEDLAIARFALAVARPKTNGKEATSDFPSIIAFGKTAEMAEKYLQKGKHIAIIGRIQTGNYTDKDGKKVYTTDVVAEKIEFLESKRNEESKDEPREEQAKIPEGFEQITDDQIPF